MNFKKLLLLFLISFSVTLFAAEPNTTYKLYGYVGNDFFFNSRQNVESVDGLILYFPKPISLNSKNEDTNAKPQAEMLSIDTRLGLDLTGMPVFGAKTSAKIEADFEGFSTSYYVFRIRQAYTKLNWKNTELLLGQTWHPLFGSVIPTIASANNGAPFHPFNRSPQLRITQKLSNSISLIAAAVYQMQYLSQGPIGASNTYLKNAIAPNLFLGSEAKTTHWTSGIGIDMKTIKPDVNEITSISGTAYAQFTHQNFQLKAKAVLGENLTESNMIGGYGISGTDNNGAATYTNLNTANAWLNAVYGTKWQVEVYTGISQNLGSNKTLASVSDKFIVYGTGASTDTQVLIDRVYRISPSVSYNFANIKLALEYDFTTATYGNMQSNGRVSNPYDISNHRVLVSFKYYF